MHVEYLIILVCFLQLHDLHKGCIFSMLSLPPFESGIIWSSVKIIFGSDFLQQGQIKLYCAFKFNHSPRV
uniref:HNH endonuclease n=1 Tax=uncultured marine virus TaxID=186617 RepID=A0A0F7L876_9VIRU|nr:HNH endonuclease [uncultured marine virus]